MSTDTPKKPIEQQLKEAKDSMNVYEWCILGPPMLAQVASQIDPDSIADKIMDKARVK